MLQKSKDMTQVVTMHANCCIGMNNKVQDLQQASKDWEFSRNAAGAPRDALWHVPSACKYSMTPPSRTRTGPRPIKTVH